jgi:uncharacterized protein
MKRLMCAPLALSLLAIFSSTAPAQDKMTTYYLVLLNRGKAPATVDQAEAAKIQEQHIAHLTKLGDQGHGLAAGPFGDDGEIRGIVIMKADSAQHVRELEEADPAVKAGRLAIDVIAFMAPEGWFKKPAQPFSMEQLYFAFLKEGATRTQDPETARRLQSEHLAYMDDQHKQGALVMAGPIVDKGSTRRGVVVYRAASLIEARTRAEGDPMVRAGRLAIEMHPWYVAKGVLQ